MDQSRGPQSEIARVLSVIAQLANRSEANRTIEERAHEVRSINRQSD